MATNDLNQVTTSIVASGAASNVDVNQLHNEIVLSYGENYVNQIAASILFSNLQANLDLNQLAAEIVIALPNAPLPPEPPTLKTKVLTQVDTWELDHGFQNWPGEYGDPIAWYENSLQQQQVGLSPTPGDVGTVGLLFVPLANALANTGVSFTVPDDWAPYIIWGALADLFGADGPSYDPVRAQYCQRRYQEGVEMARLVLGGQE